MSEVEYLSAREIAIREFNSLRGRLCTVIESANLPTRQERALIQMIKNVSYQNQAVVTELIEKLNGSEALFHYAESKLANER
jgi:GTP-sensing pleiotropic transcriptional regulator CodY